MKNVNCIYYGKNGECLHPKQKKLLWIFTPTCWDDKCNLKSPYPKSSGPFPAPPPKNEDDDGLPYPDSDITEGGAQIKGTTQLSPKVKTCQTCIHWSACLSHKDIYDPGISKDFSANGICNRHSDTPKGNALAICSSEGIIGEFVTKKAFSCIEYEFDEYWAKRLLDENQEYYNSNRERERKSRRENRRRAKEELQKIREGIKNGIYISPAPYFHPKGFNILESGKSFRVLKNRRAKKSKREL